MRQTQPTSAALLALALISLSAAATGCVEEDKARPYSSFTDISPALPGGGNELRPLALGATMELRIFTGFSTLTSAISTDPTVFKVTIDEEKTLRVTGVGEGTATLVIGTSDGRDGAQTIEVAEAADTIVRFFPWDPLFALPDALFDEGLVVLPNSPVTVFAQNFDAQGRELGGFGSSQWSVQEGELGTVTPGEGDFATLRSLSQVGTMTLGYGGREVAVEIVPEDAIATVSFIDVLNQTPIEVEAGQRFEMYKNQISIVHVVARTEDGRYAVGAGSQPISIDLGEGADLFDLLFAPNHAQDLVDDEDEDAERILSNSRAFSFAAQQTGQATLSLSWLGRVETLEIVVNP